MHGMHTQRIEMTSAQFSALRQLMGWHQGSAVVDACRLVLVDGLTHAAAAEATGVARPNVTASLRKVRQVQEAAQVLAAPTT